MAEEEESVQLSISDVFGYKIPPKASAAGHKGAEWKDQVWCGKLQVVTKGKNVAIRLIFAVAPVRKDGPAAVEKVSDSSRFFVLRIENAAGAYAFVGIGFNQRSDAFDFNVALQDALKDMDDSKAAALLNLGPLGTDFSFKEGEKITIKVNIDGKKSGGGGAAGGGGGAAATGGLLKLRAPGSGAGAAPAPAPAAPAPAPASGGDWVSF